MQIDIEAWMKQYLSKLKNLFGSRLEFVGLQGSYGRREASAGSDIDTVVILDNLTMKDLKKYREILSRMPCKEKACGFISGQKELINWDRSDLFQFYYDTKPVYGNIDFLRPLIKKADIMRAIKLGACNLYHACCHNFLYEKSADILSALFKTSFFILQAKHFIVAGRYVNKKTRLVPCLDGIDKEILEICINREQLTSVSEDEFILYSEKLLTWSSSLLQAF